MHVHDMPDKDTRAPWKARPAASSTPRATPTPTRPPGATASWRRLGYSNVIDAVNLRPYVQFLHDVSGNSPAPSGPFVEGRTAITIGLRADYL